MHARAYSRTFANWVAGSADGPRAGSPPALVGAPARRAERPLIRRQTRAGGERARTGGVAAGSQHEDCSPEDDRIGEKGRITMKHFRSLMLLLVAVFALNVGVVSAQAAEGEKPLVEEAEEINKEKIEEAKEKNKEAKERTHEKNKERGELAKEHGLERLEKVKEKNEERIERAEAKEVKDAEKAVLKTQKEKEKAEKKKLHEEEVAKKKEEREKGKEGGEEGEPV
jgi:hypothetical protein